MFRWFRKKKKQGNKPKKNHNNSIDHAPFIPITSVEEEDKNKHAYEDSSSDVSFDSGGFDGGGGGD